MADTDWRLGRIRVADDNVIDGAGKALLVAEVHSRALTVQDGGLIACYPLIDDIDDGVALRAIQFFGSQVELLVDAQELVDDAGAEFPALVTVRYVDDIPGYLASCQAWDLLREIPSATTIARSGWELFCALEGIGAGRAVGEAAELPPFDFRALRKKVFASRASVQQDASPWLEDELARLRRATEHNPEGAEVFVAIADDIEAALRGEVLVGDTFAVVIPSKLERAWSDGAFFDWHPQAGREFVVAHGLDALQAARVLRLVREDPKAYLLQSEIMTGGDVRETVGEPIIVRDAALNWISTDLSGRRNQAGYERLKAMLNGPRPLDATHMTREQNSR